MPAADFHGVAASPADTVYSGYGGRGDPPGFHSSGDQVKTMRLGSEQSRHPSSGHSREEPARPTEAAPEPGVQGQPAGEGTLSRSPLHPQGLPVRARGVVSHESSLQMRVHCRPRRAPGKEALGVRGTQASTSGSRPSPSGGHSPRVTGFPAAGRGTRLPGAMPGVQAGTAQLPGWGHGAPSPTGCRGCADGGCADCCSENPAPRV